MTVTAPARFANQRHAMLAGFSQAGVKGATAEEAAEMAGVSMRSCYWKRASELRGKELLEPVVRKGEQEFRISGANGHQGVWKITPAGRQQLKAWSKSI
jgi:transposase